MAGNPADVITCAYFQNEIFRDYNFTGVEFPIFQLIFAWALQHRSANALPVILCRGDLLFSLVPSLWCFATKTVLL